MEIEDSVFKEFRVKRIVLPAKMFEALAAGGTVQIVSGIPRGAKAISLSANHAGTVGHLFMEHDSFPLVAQGAMTEELPVEFKIECPVLDSQAV